MYGAGKDGKTMSKPATEDDVWTVAILLLVAVMLFAILGEVKDTKRHAQILNELCHMQYPECVVGVDR